MDPIEPVDINAPKIIPHAEKETYIAKHNAHIQPVRTFSSDLADAVREQGGSVVRIAIAEEEKQRKEFQETSIKSKKNMVFTILGFILIAGAIGGIVWGYSYKKSASVAPVVVDVKPSSIISAENSQTIDATGMEAKDIVAAVNAIVLAPNIQSGTIKNIVVNQGAVRINTSQFIPAIGGAHAPADFLRSLDDSMLGVYLYNKANLFVVLHGTAHDFLLSGILAWEPYLLQELAPLFAVDVTGANAPALNAKWNDAVIENRDARAVIGADKKPLLFYSFLDPNTIIIATDAKTLTAVVQRY